jgi:hypothetical protein
MQFTESMIFIREDFATFWRDEGITIKQGWRKHRDISKQLHYNTNLIDKCEERFGVYVWAPEFANVHATFPFKEKPFVIDGIEWPHSEGYYQAMKAFGTNDWEFAKREIQKRDPMDSWSLGQTVSLRRDWEEVKADIMMRALREKFKDPYLRSLLISTDGYPLVQLKHCSYWGSGLDGKGENKLGELLQQLRDEIKK